MKCRKKTVVVETFHHTRDKVVKDFQIFMGGNDKWRRGTDGEIYIETLEGLAVVKIGECILKDAEGGLYTHVGYI